MTSSLNSELEVPFRCDCDLEGVEEEGEEKSRSWVEIWRRREEIVVVVVVVVVVAVSKGVLGGVEVVFAADGDWVRG